MNEDFLKQVRHLEIYAKKYVNHIFSGNYISSFKGQGIEFHSIREYQDGDDVRFIDAITTSKQGKLFVKQFQESRERNMVLCVDASASMNFTSTGKTKAELALEVASILLFSAIKSGDTCSAIIWNNHTIKYISASTGTNQVLIILYAIIDMLSQNDQDSPLLSFDSVTEFCKKHISKHSICIFLTDKLPHKEKNITFIAKKTDCIYGICSDPFEQGEIPLGNFHFQDSLIKQDTHIYLNNTIRKKYAKIRNERYARTFSYIHAIGADVLLLSTKEISYKTLSLFFKQRQKQH